VTRLGVGVGLLVWLGATLLLSEWHRLARPSLAERLRPYSPGGSSPSNRVGAGILSLESFREMVAPLAQSLGDRCAGLFGIRESLEVRLHRVHAPYGPATFRTRQLGWSGAALAVALVVSALGSPVAADALALLGLPLLAFLVVEHRLSRLSAAWQATLTRELPVVSEQLAMLLNAGYSLGAAINRLAARGQGCSALDLARVANRVRQGVDEAQALREWAETARVGSLDRLVSVLALNSEASDLGRLVSAEARQARHDVQRMLTELIERRSQQVWVPVAVATLVPGVILLAVPFLAALRLFSGS
jgi:tight adherence protein C